MENAQLVSLSRQSALRRQFDLLANNIANANTVGFKGRGMRFEEFRMQNAKADEDRGLARQIAFVADRGLTLDLSDGALMRTGAPLDLAIRGRSLLAVMTPEGERYTRSGALSLDDQSRLVTADGHLVMGDGGPMTADPQNMPLSITSDGVLTGRDGPIGQLRFVRVDNPDVLINEGRNVYSAKTPLPDDAAPVVVPGALEKSNVEPVLAMSRLIEVNRAYASLTGLMQRLDEKNGTALERLAAIPN